MLSVLISPVAWALSVALTLVNSLSELGGEQQFLPAGGYAASRIPAATTSGRRAAVFIVPQAGRSNTAMTGIALAKEFGTMSVSPCERIEIVTAAYYPVEGLPTGTQASTVAPKEGIPD